MKRLIGWLTLSFLFLPLPPSAARLPLIAPPVEVPTAPPPLPVLEPPLMRWTSLCATLQGQQKYGEALSACD